MQNRLNDILYDTGEEIFENLAFVLTMPEGDLFGDDNFDFDAVSLDPNDLDARLGDTSLDAEDDFDIMADDNDEDSPSESFQSDSFQSDSFVGFEEMEPASDETIVASIHFSGHFEGDLFLETSCDLLPVIGMNMLGLDDENSLTHEEQKDAFRELLNVICGNLLPALAGQKAVFNIDGAEIHSETSIPETFEGQTPRAMAHFGLEVGHARLVLFVDENAWEELKTTAPSCV